MRAIRESMMWMSCVACLTLPVVAGASTYQEMGDATALPPGTITTGVGPLLDGIHGSLADSLDVDLYRITIISPGLFSATVVQGSEFDAQLFLFSPGGVGISHNDDTPPGGLPEAMLTSTFVATGVYLLAISARNRDPLAGPGLPIWMDTPINTERAPDGPGMGPVNSWSGTPPAVDYGDYWIVLTGCDTASPAPQPGVFNEMGDAPDLSPMATNGAGTLNTIIGSFPDSLDVDVYCIEVTNPAVFSATTAGVTFDTQIFLYDAAGRGIVHNDDSPVFGTRLSRVTGTFVQAAHYYLAVSSYNRDPVAAGLMIWNDDTVPVERAPDGPGASTPFDGWVGDGEAASGYYAIALTGANYCPTLPTPVKETPVTLTLRAHPNPFNPNVRIDYILPHSGEVTLRIYDAGGRRVRDLVERHERAGARSATWDGRDARGGASASGVYFVRLVSRGREVTTKVVLLK